MRVALCNERDQFPRIYRVSYQVTYSVEEDGFGEVAVDLLLGGKRGHCALDDLPEWVPVIVCLERNSTVKKLTKRTEVWTSYRPG